MLVDNVPGSQDLHDKSQKMALPQLVILKGVCPDVVRASKVGRQWCSEGDEPVLAQVLLRERLPRA